MKFVWKLIFVLILLGLFIYLIFYYQENNKINCQDYSPQEKEVYDENVGSNVLVDSCPKGCSIGSCYGLKTACCPE